MQAANGTGAYDQRPGKGRRDYKQPLGSLGEITALGGQAGQLQQSAGVGALHGRSRAGEKR